MKTSDSTTTPTFYMSSILKPYKRTKSFRFNRRLHNRMASLDKRAAIMVPINNYEIIPMPSLLTNNQSILPNPMLSPINNKLILSNSYTPPAILPLSPPINQQPPIAPTYPLPKPFTTPRVTTTLIPLNICPTEYCQPTRPTPLVNIVENRQEQNKMENKSKNMVTTHLIDDWIIRESSQPFQRKENERLTPIKQLVNEEKKVNSNESVTSSPYSSSNVCQWTTDDVCSFFERILGKDCYNSMIEEHLIDGTALLLLEDEHLNSIFKMPLGPRLKLLNRIKNLKNNDFSDL